MIISETGADALAGRHAGPEELFSEEHMESLYRRQIEILRGMDFVTGISPWILYDFRSPRRQNRFQQGYNRKGLIAEDKVTRKMAFYVLKEFYEGMGK